MLDIKDMAPKCEVGLGGAAIGVEKLWQYVFQLKTRVEQLEKSAGQTNQSDSGE